MSAADHDNDVEMKESSQQQPPAPARATSRSKPKRSAGSSSSGGGETAKSSKPRKPKASAIVLTDDDDEASDARRAAAATAGIGLPSSSSSAAAPAAPAAPAAAAAAGAVHMDQSADVNDDMDAPYVVLPEQQQALQEPIAPAAVAADAAGRRQHRQEPAAERKEGKEGKEAKNSEADLVECRSPDETLAQYGKDKQAGPQVLGRIDDHVTNERLKEMFEIVFAKWTAHNGKSVREHMLKVYGISESKTPYPQEIEVAYRMLLVEISQLKQWFMARRLISQTGFEMRFNQMFETLWDSKLMLTTECSINARRGGGGSSAPMDMLRFKPMNFADLKPVPCMILYAQRQASMLRLRKRGNYLYQEIRTANGQHGTHAWRQWKTFEGFLMHICSKNQQFVHWTNLTYQYIRRDVVTFLRDCEDEEIPWYLPQTAVTAWEDPVTHEGGLYFAEERGWVPFGHEIDDSITACKKFDRKFPHDVPITHHMELKTPIDTILEFQKFTPEEQSFIWCMLGRLVMTPKKLDGWEQFLMLWGQARAGKGCILEAVRLFMPSEDQGVMSNTMEPIFGLQKYVLHKMVLMMDIKRNFPLDAGTFQCMISHENVSIPVKNKDPVIMEWNITMMGAGNEFPWGWRDRLGSMADRFVLVQFFEKPTEVNTHIKKELEPMIGYIYRKAVLAYHWWCNKAGFKGIGGVMPKKFLDARDYIKQQGNPLECFLSSDQVEIFKRDKSLGNKQKDPVYDRYYCLHSVFMETFKQYAKDLHMRVAGHPEEDIRASLKNRGIEYDFKTPRAWPPNNTAKDGIIEDQFYIGIRLKKPVQNGLVLRLVYPTIDGKISDQDMGKSGKGGNKKRKSSNDKPGAAAAKALETKRLPPADKGDKAVSNASSGSGSGDVVPIVSTGRLPGKGPQSPTKPTEPPLSVRPATRLSRRHQAMETDDDGGPRQG